MSVMRFAAVCVLLAIVGPAYAEDPWTAGVTAEQKQSARGLLDAGNTLFLAHDYAGALDKYRQALAFWDHPAIRFNVVRCLIQLDRTAEAAENLKLALRYGSAPLEEAVYNEALAYEKLLANQIGDLEVRCTQAGVAVTLDGQPLLACPGAQTRRVTPGRHQLVGSKDGFLTKSSDVVVVGGQREQVDVSLVSIGSAAIAHRWAQWKPWVVIGSGLAVVGVGGLLQYQASVDMSSYDHQLTLLCADTGCGPSRPIPGNVADEKTRAERENAIAIGVMSAGAAAAVVGGVLLYMNRGIAVYPNVEHVPGGAAVSLGGRF
jgi:hypothetical protein